jgi:ERCC4-related helicase
VQQVVRNLRIERIDARSDDDPDVRKYVHGRTTDIIELPVSSAITALR